METYKELDSIIKGLVNSIKHSKDSVFELYNKLEQEIFYNEKALYNIIQDMNTTEASFTMLQKVSIEKRKELLDITTDIKNLSSNENQIKYSEVYKSTERILEDISCKEKKCNELFKERDTVERNLLRLKKTISSIEDTFKSIEVSLSCFSESVVEIDELIDRKDAISLKMIESQENERKRISRDIHDSVAQTITYSIINTNILEKMIEKHDFEKSKLKVKDIHSDLTKILSGIRTIIYDLRPMSLDDMGLVATLESYICNYEETNNIKTKLLVYGNQKKITKLSTTNQASIFRVIQESLNNTAKHSKAQNVIIKIEVLETGICFTISDNGIGFDKNKEFESDKLGLIGIRERIELLSSSLNISSKDNKGTTISFKISTKE